MQSIQDAVEQVKKEIEGLRNKAIQNLEQSKADISYCRGAEDGIKRLAEVLQSPEKVSVPVPEKKSNGRKSSNKAQ